MHWLPLCCRVAPTHRRACSGSLATARLATSSLVPSCQQESPTSCVLLLGAVFTNRLEDLRISELAEEDRKELVSGVQVRTCCL